MSEGKIFSIPYFPLANGVKQGGVISAIPFSLNNDLSLEEVKYSRVGCH